MRNRNHDLHSLDGNHEQITELLGDWRLPGYLMVIGGADRLDPEARLSRLFIVLAHRAAEQTDLRDIVLVSTATRHPEVLTGEYIRIFTRLGVVGERIHAPFIRTHE